MKKNTRYIIIGLIILVGIGFLVYSLKPYVRTKPRLPAWLSLSMPHLPAPKHGLALKPGTYQQLPGWGSTNLKQSLLALRVSCHAFSRQDPNSVVGSRYIPLKAKDWAPACNAATQIDENSNDEIQLFFQTWFKPVEFQQGRPIHGLFTGYYLPSLQGSLTKSEHFSVPIYAVPPSLVTANLSSFSSNLPHHKIVGHVVAKKVVPFYTREAIDHGVISDSTPVLAWVNNSIDRLILETEGSGFVELKEGGQLAIGFAADNGAKYRSIASILIKKGSMNKDQASMSHIRSYFKKHPAQLRPVINQNKSFVFFRQLPQNTVVGSQGVPISPGYTLAVDRQWIPMGVPLWLTTTIQDVTTNTPKAFNRLMIAQDTGGSIRGMVRGDIYWGAGEKAKTIATKISSSGHYWLLLPKTPKAY
ncbi:MAG: murein transglycosylase A [Legionellaceae bacterium]|nr:murein transglycosylase A [Legionellaceae bacterium]